MLPDSRDLAQKWDSSETAATTWSTLGAMGAMILLAFFATADSPMPDDPAFTEGLRLLEDFEYEKAIFRFREALRDPQKTQKQKAICHVYVGLTLAELREEDGAIDAFADAVRADAFVTLPPDASPKVKELLDIGRRRVASESAPAENPEPAPPRVEEPAPAPEVASSAPAGDGGGVLFLAAGGTGLGLGVASLAGAGGLLALALVWNQEAEAAQFADDAAGLRDNSVAAQIGAGVLAGVGAVLVAGGAALLVVGVME